MSKIRYSALDEWYSSFVTLEVEDELEISIPVPDEGRFSKDAIRAEKILSQISELIENGTIDISEDK